MQTLFLQGPSVTLRMIILVIASIVLMTVDHRWNHLQIVRTSLSHLLYPLQYTIDLPIRFFYWADEIFTTHGSLLDENRKLKAQQLEYRVQLQKLDIIEKENERLRLLLSATPKTREKVLISEIVGVDVDPFSHLVVVNKGSADGVYEGQPVIDAHGVVGQTLFVNAMSSTVMLITDASHALPVQIDRTGHRSIAFGTGQIDHLDLKHIPQNTDIRVGDTLITSGLGGRFPNDYPVALITNVERIPGEAFARVKAEPLALLEQSRELLLVWTEEPESIETETIEPVADEEPNVRGNRGAQ